jgi:hypothetical protein
MFAASLLPLNVALTVTLCNGDLDRPGGETLRARHTGVGVLRGSMAGLHLVTVSSVKQSAMHQCLLNTDEKHAMLIATVRGTSYTKEVPLAVLAVPNAAAAAAITTLSPSDAALVDAVMHATFACTSALRRGELCVVPLRAGGWCWAIVVCEAELVDYPCYLNRDVAHPQRVATVSLLDAHANWRRQRKRLPLYFVGKLPDKYHRSPFAATAHRNWTARAASLPPDSTTAATTTTSAAAAVTTVPPPTTLAALATTTTSTAVSSLAPPPPSQMLPPPSRPKKDLPVMPPPRGFRLPDSVQRHSASTSHVDPRASNVPRTAAFSSSSAMSTPQNPYPQYQQQQQKHHHQQQQQQQQQQHHQPSLPNRRPFPHHQPYPQQHHHQQQQHQPPPSRHSTFESRKRPVPSFVQTEPPPARRALLPTPQRQGVSIPLVPPTMPLGRGRGGHLPGSFRSNPQQ